MIARRTGADVTRQPCRRRAGMSHAVHRHRFPSPPAEARGTRHALCTTQRQPRAPDPTTRTTHGRHQASRIQNRPACRQHRTAVALLHADHKEVKQLFKSYDALVAEEARTTRSRPWAADLRDLNGIARSRRRSSIRRHAKPSRNRPARRGRGRACERKGPHRQYRAMGADEDRSTQRSRCLGEYLAHT